METSIPTHDLPACHPVDTQQKARRPGQAGRADHRVPAGLLRARGPGMQGSRNPRPSAVKVLHQATCLPTVGKTDIPT